MNAKLTVIIVTSLLLGGCSGLQVYSFNKSGERHGKYIVYWEKGRPMQKGRFKNGQEKGTWKCYDIEGNLEKKEKYKDNQILTTFYRPDGSKESTGIAYLYFDGNFARYSWEGVWHYYNVSDDYIYSVNYVKGEPVDTIHLNAHKFLINERSSR